MTYNLPCEVEERVRRDLVAFADTRTIVEVIGNEVQWIQRRSRRKILLAPPFTDNLPGKVIYNGSDFEYRQFFASEHMANILWLSEEVERLLEELPECSAGAYLKPRVQVENGDTASDESYSKDFEESLVAVCRPDAGKERTSLVFLQGRAGDGKSTGLIQLAHRQAKLYAEGNSEWIFLYIDAQGRALARLDEAVALILDDLNSTFRYQALSVLTRLGLIVPIIDGFDELLGSGGYEDAFSSLESFLIRLDGYGSVITSARSTFYRYSALSRAASRLTADKSDVDIMVHNVHLLPWNKAQTCEYLRSQKVASLLCSGDADIYDDNAVYRAAEQWIGRGADEILSTPFLLSRFAALVLDGENNIQGRSVLVSAVKSLVRRELVEKILHPEKGQILTEEQFEKLFGAVAEEMWWQETRTLDEDTFLTVAEICLEGMGIEKSVSRVLLGKLTSNAVIAIGEGTRHFSFRHEIYFSYFIAKFFSNSITKGNPKDIVAVLSRAIISAPLAHETIGALGEDKITYALSTLNDLPAEGVSSDIIRTNKGSLVSAVLKEFGKNANGFRLNNLKFESSDFSGSILTDVHFKNCRFERPDLRKCNWSNVSFDECTLTLPLVSEGTCLNIAGVSMGENILGVRIYEETTRKETIFYKQPNDLSLFSKVGLDSICSNNSPQFTEAQLRFIERLHTVIRVASRSIYFSNQDFENRGQALSNVRDVLDAGSRFGLWERSDKQRGGKRELYRLLVSPEDILIGESGQYSDKNIRDFWDYVSKIEK